jgi:hypothetical protein
MHHDGAGNWLKTIEGTQENASKVSDFVLSQGW